MRILITGIQPTGNIHIGNYLGFIRPLVKLQNDSRFDKRILLIADLHSISTGFKEPSKLKDDIINTLAVLLSAGVQSSRTILVQQSKLLEHTELMWILGAAITLPNLMNSTQFKEKSRSYKKGSVPVGLVTYPLLQAADILAYKSTHVLVGNDQNQHLNIVRNVARSFNRILKKDYFPIPEQVFDTESSRIKSLVNSERKMSKSDIKEKSRINLTDSAEIIINKVKGSLSDFNPKITYEPNTRPAISNLVNLYSAFSGMSSDHVIEESKDLDTFGFKNKLATLINSNLTPIREKYQHYISNKTALMKILEDGEEEAQPIVKKTLYDIKKIVGFI